MTGAQEMSEKEHRQNPMMEQMRILGAPISAATDPTDADCWTAMFSSFSPVLPFLAQPPLPSHT